MGRSPFAAGVSDQSGTLSPRRAAPRRGPLDLLDEGALAIGTESMLQVALDYLGATSS